MKPVINADECTGCGLCETTDPETFKLNDDGIAIVIKEDGVDAAKLDEAIEQCPVECISKG